MPELELLRRLAPAPDPPDARAYERARGRVRTRMNAAAGAHSRSRRRWLLPAAGLGATAAAALVVFLSVGTGGESIASASAALREAAAVARVQDPPPALGAGQYLYTRSTDVYLTTAVNEGGASYSVLVPHEREIWLNRAGTGWLYETSGTPRFLSERDRESWIAAGRPALGDGTMNLPLSNSDGTTSPMASLDLPTDPDALWARLEADARGRGNGLYEEMFTIIGDSLRETFTTPQQRAALYEVAARLPGVELVGQAEDSAGRDGVAVAMADKTNGIRYELIFDPATAVLLGERQTLLAHNWGNYPEGTVIGEAAYVDSAVVDTIGTRPDGSTVSADCTYGKLPQREPGCLS